MYAKSWHATKVSVFFSCFYCGLNQTVRWKQLTPIPSLPRSCLWVKMNVRESVHVFAISSWKTHVRSQESEWIADRIWTQGHVEHQGLFSVLYCISQRNLRCSLSHFHSAKRLKSKVKGFFISILLSHELQHTMIQTALRGRIELLRMIATEKNPQAPQQTS